MGNILAMKVEGGVYILGAVAEKPQSSDCSFVSGVTVLP